jgi:hypothetical protein
MSDLLPLGAPSYEELAARQHQHRRLGHDDELDEQCGAYRLRARIPAGPGDECFVAVRDGLAGFTRLVFLRRFPRDRLGSALTAAVQRRAEINHHGVEQLFELGAHGRYGYLVSELVEGLGVDHLEDALRARGERLPWPIALALFHDACERVTHLYAAGVVPGDVTPARLRLGLTGSLYLCHGLPAAEPAWGRALCDVARPLLRLAAAEEERGLIDELLGDADGEGALAVASDALVLRHPELDPLLPALLLSALEGAPLAMGRVTSMILADLPYLAIHRLWELVAEILAAPRPPRR